MENRSQRTAEEIFPILRDLTERYTSKESTSVTVERAQSLLDAVFYCMNEAVDQWEAEGTGKDLPDGPGRPLEALDTAALYSRGYELALKKTLEAKKIYEELLPDFETYGNMAYRDTVLSGMPEFFLRYDVRFAPQEHLLMLDYPLLIPQREDLEGIDRILEYLQRTRLEQKFLTLFPKPYVIQVLNRFHRAHEELIFNLCGVILNNTLGHMLAEKPLGNLGFSEEELEHVSREIGRMAEKELEGLLKVSLRGLTYGSFGGDPELYSYLSLYLPEAVIEMRQVAELECPERLFLL